MPRLSARLQALLDMLEPGCELADIACDHAHLSIEAVGRGLAPRAVACDLNEAPLRAARAELRAAGLEGRIELRRGDAFAPLHESPTAAKVAVIAGIGGRLMARMIEAPAPVGPPARVERLLLQPNRDGEFVRRALVARGWHLREECLVPCGGRRYLVLDALRGDDSTHRDWGPMDWRWGPRLIARRDPELLAALLDERARLDAAIDAAERGGASVQKLAALHAERESVVALHREMSSAP